MIEMTFYVMFNSEELTEPDYIGPFYKLDDAEVAIVVLGSTAGTTRVIVNKLREAGIRAGLLKLRSFRPFPAEQIAKELAGVKAVAALDRSMSPGAIGAPLFQEIRSALYDQDSRVPVLNYIYGLGGRDVSMPNIEQVFSDLSQVADNGLTGPVIRYLGLKE